MAAGTEAAVASVAAGSHPEHHVHTVRLQAEEHRRAGYQLVERSIPVTTLARVCDQYRVPTIDFLKVFTAIGTAEGRGQRAE